MGSSDLQASNLDQRIELLTPICDETERGRLVDSVLEGYFRDTLNSMEFGADLRLRPLSAEQIEQPSEPATSRIAAAVRRIS
jgi:polyphosphate kinase